jgi:UDP-3-O-[3-hydroxymyristoyl] glucosamine N-acyltransferase
MNAQSIAQHLGAILEGETLEVTHLASPENPSAGSVIVVSDDKQLASLDNKTLALVVINQNSTYTPHHPYIKVKETRLALARLSQLFDDRPSVAEGIHPSAVIHESSHLEEDVHIAEGVVIKANVRIGKGSRIGANSVISQDVHIGQYCLLHPNVTLYAKVRLSNRVIIHSGAVVGSDGFGYAPGPRGAAKIHHLGSVELHDDVEIGANTCIDRGTLSNTIIGARTKIDNLCQIGHNVKIGTDCLIAGRGGISGSVTIGNRVTMGGSVIVADHISIADGVTLAGNSGVTKNIPQGETWAGFPAEPFRKWVRGLYLQGQLETIWQKVKGER